LAAAGHCVSIDELILRTQNIGRWIEKLSGLQFEGHERAGSDGFFSLKITPVESGSNKQPRESGTP
jgi:hypothetical protein